MNKKSIYFGTLVLTALTLGSCASDDTATEKTAGKDTPKIGTVFSSETEPATRTSATYTGSGLDFYWTASDKIWVKDDNGNYNQSASDDISSRIAAVPGSTTTDKAKFCNRQPWYIQLHAESQGSLCHVHTLHCSSGYLWC